RGGGVGEGEAVGIGEARGVPKIAAKADGELAVLPGIEPHRALNRPGDGEVALAIGSLDDLGQDPAGGLEGAVQVPARAGAAEPAEGEAFAGEALGDVPRRVDPQHEKGDAARTDTVERGQP